jgi:hypothetical protein
MTTTLPGRGVQILSDPLPQLTRSGGRRQGTDNG